MIPPITPGRTCTLALAITLSLGAATARAQQDALVIDKDAVKITTSLSVTGRATAETFSGSFFGMGAVPVGAIIMWSGKPDQLPTGWVLCNGTKDTPDLSARFVVGYDKSNLAEYDVNKTGGEAKHALTLEEMPAHNHAATASSAGEHQHEISSYGSGDATSLLGGGFLATIPRGDPRSDPFLHVKGTSSGEHTHGVTVASTGGGKPHENRPPYYTLAYIMYVGVPDGTYLFSCRKAELADNILQAECRATDGSWKTTNLDLNSCQVGPGDISNQKGQLACLKK